MRGCKKLPGVGGREEILQALDREEKGWVVEMTRGTTPWEKGVTAGKEEEAAEVAAKPEVGTATDAPGTAARKQKVQKAREKADPPLAEEAMGARMAAWREEPRMAALIEAGTAAENSEADCTEYAAQVPVRTNLLSDLGLTASYLSDSGLHLRLALSQAFPPLFRGENPGSPSPARLFGLGPRRPKPNRRGLLLQQLLAPPSSRLGLQGPVQLLALALLHVPERSRRPVTQDLLERYLGKPSRKHTKSVMSGAWPEKTVKVQISENREREMCLEEQDGGCVVVSKYERTNVSESVVSMCMERAMQQAGRFEARDASKHENRTYGFPG